MPRSRRTLGVRVVLQTHDVSIQSREKTSHVNIRHPYWDTEVQSSRELAAHSVERLPLLIDRRAAHAVIEYVYDEYHRAVPDVSANVDMPIAVLRGERLLRVHGPRVTDTRLELADEEDINSECMLCDFGCASCSPLIDD